MKSRSTLNRLGYRLLVSDAFRGYKKIDIGSCSSVTNIHVQYPIILFLNKASGFMRRGGMLDRIDSILSPCSLITC